MNQDGKDNLEFELSQYLDGELGGWRARRLERRLEQDSALQEELKKYAALDEQLCALGRKDLAGADYDWQRTEVVRMLERKRLLEARRPRPVFFRPVFWGAGGALAVAAGLVVGIVIWMSSPGGTVSPPATVASEVSVALVVPAASAQSQAQARLRRLDENDFRLAGPPAEEQDMEIATRLRPPPGTVMVSFTPSRPSQWSAGNFVFPAEF